MNVQHQVSLKALNTFGLDVKAEAMVQVDSESALSELLQTAHKYSSLLVLGGGSNVLFTKDVEGLVLLNRVGGITVEDEDTEHVLLRCGAGVIWDDVVQYAVDHRLGGIENLSIIPGRCGAAPMQNIGAYGVELKDVFESLRAVSAEDGSIRTFNREDCEFGYRESVFKHKLKSKYVISSLLLRLDKQHTLHMDYGAIKDTLARQQISRVTIRDVRNAVISIRTSKLPDPAELGNAGSFFKNPEISKAQFEGIQQAFPEAPNYPLENGLIKVPAGWMIEQCGWKGKKVGNTGAHAKQALVLVNYGGAKGNEIYSLAMEIQQSVKEKFGVEISPEVNVI